MRSEKQLKSFIEYCREHPEERFWQAVRNWSGSDFVLICDTVSYGKNGTDLIFNDPVDTYYFEGRNK